MSVGPVGKAECRRRAGRPVECATTQHTGPNGVAQRAGIGGCGPLVFLLVPASKLHAPVLEWYAEHARDLPWRRPGVSAWGVLVSEVMLQQTPVVRVLPVWEQWMERWPAPADLADVPAGEA